MSVKTDLRVKIDAELLWIEPAGSEHERMLRKQANVKLRVLAAKFEEPLKELILVATASLGHTENG